MNIQSLVHEFKLNDPHDAWGNCIEWLFNICEELNFNRNVEIPVEWQYMPSPFGYSVEEDNSTAETIRECDDNLLLKFGALLHRYADYLKRHGRDY